MKKKEWKRRANEFEADLLEANRLLATYAGVPPVHVRPGGAKAVAESDVNGLMIPIDLVAKGEITYSKFREVLAEWLTGRREWTEEWQDVLSELSDERQGTLEHKQKAHSSYVRDKRKLRNSKLMRDFGITIEQYERMLDEQGGVCAICGGNDKSKALAVDHDHETGRVRGLLCSRCNPAIGLFLDNVGLMAKAMEYIGANNVVPENQ